LGEGEGLNGEANRSAAPGARPLTLREVFSAWYPLAGSWLLMGLELPAVSAIISRLPDPKVSLAAYGGVVFPLSMIIEAPIIMLLSASTALSRDRRSYLMLRRFMLRTGLVLTLLHALIAFTPLFDLVVGRIIHPPADVLAPARLGLMIMTPWTWSIAYRRFQQGVLIRNGRSHLVGIGTLVRLGANAAILTAGMILGNVPGVVVGATAVAVGVMSESLFIGIAVRPTLCEQFGNTAFRTIRDLLPRALRPSERSAAGGSRGGLDGVGRGPTCLPVIGTGIGDAVMAEGGVARASLPEVGTPQAGDSVGPGDSRPPLTWGAFFEFYIPLALTSLLLMSTGPIVSASVSRMPRPLDSLAVWPVINGLTFILRSLGMAVNEVVVAHLDRPGAIRSLRRFSILLGLATTSIFAVVGFTPLARIYFARVSALSPELTALATKAVRIVVVMPGLGALQSWFQGVLVHSRRTRGITESVVIYLGINLVLLTLGMRFVNAPGIFVGLGAVVGAAVCQLFWLWRRSRPALGGLIAGGSGR
jgi:hypothetical protein